MSFSFHTLSGQPGSDLAWYVNGLLVPELFLRRELTYNFQVEGGNDPHSPTHYHPLIITDEALGGYEQMTEEQRKDIRVLAGVEFTRRGQPRPTAAGRLCLWRPTGQRDRRLDNDVTSFEKFRNSLQLLCEEGTPIDCHVFGLSVAVYFTIEMNDRRSTSKHRNPARQLVAGRGLLPQLHSSGNGLENQHSGQVRWIGHQRRSPDELFLGGPVHGSFARQPFLQHYEGLKNFLFVFFTQ